MLKKQCTKCKETKSLDEFHRERSRRDGLRSYCKACQAVWQKAYWQTEKGKEAHTRSSLKYILCHPEKQKAITAVNNAIRLGKMLKPDNCSNCGDSKERIEGHHPDYSKPLEVTWLCQPCHTTEHKIFPQGRNHE